MPHYKDGTEAKVGDLIKGTGYNIKDASGKPAIIVGALARITPDSDSCNLIILTTVAQRLDKDDASFAYRVNEADRIMNNYPGGIVDNTQPMNELWAVTTNEEYGAIKDFELIHRSQYLGIAAGNPSSPTWIVAPYLDRLRRENGQR
jgi:hypothetical protein